MTHWLYAYYLHREWQGALIHTVYIKKNPKNSLSNNAMAFICKMKETYKMLFSCSNNEKWPQRRLTALLIGSSDVQSKHDSLNYPASPSSTPITHVFHLTVLLPLFFSTALHFVPVLLLLSHFSFHLPPSLAMKCKYPHCQSFLFSYYI